ncbi:hypothetical protein AN7406.2 [Aspergillus nidulans FGSC A4]|uniref:Integral membrane protein PTH11-like, putative (AFU_orthologue AFUA_5G13715) n=1 Tax=Emericella nidulans (strain FGSC A4 / ATCC 38163 / CBS 112.46 / NRRL 194 / M139) TaxID=227321 RepID=Q5AWC4_EMENI|nr:hypothetical protein [Aspergillus nidulans FGSC A4]EAA61777.1 hypothetical protein AN7406.2 [Aspergillus nidulans FGSC A4]CBF78443.1 TPA: integral membrane protein PTH11-like, putative (AFU_orthologue; AFUA_5G13715) [Aspergillus nidulans FGSC A4]|eukprot:XP_680675.1 hypothetical protein AN7406.2 [Aspergillus nidulans FGSC A4]
MGRHIEAVDEEDVKTFMLGDYIFSHLYDFAIASTKLSVLALYHRIFPKPVFRRIVILTAVFVVLWLMTMELVLGFQCRPIQRFWDQDVDGDCFNLVAFSYFTNITNLVTDMWILVLPLPTILRLQWIAEANEVRTCTVSAARLSVVVSQGSTDFTCKAITLLTLLDDPYISGAGVPLGILSVWEPLGGILCANLPLSHKLVLSAFRKVTGRTSSERNHLSPTGPRSWYRLENYLHRKANRNLETNSTEMGGIVVQRNFEQVSSYTGVDLLRQEEETGVPDIRVRVDPKRPNSYIDAYREEKL